MFIYRYNITFFSKGFNYLNWLYNANNKQYNTKQNNNKIKNGNVNYT